MRDYWTRDIGKWGTTAPETLEDEGLLDQSPVVPHFPVSLVQKSPFLLGIHWLVIVVRCNSFSDLPIAQLCQESGGGWLC